MSFNLLWLVRIILSTLDTIPNKVENFMMSFLHLFVFLFVCNPIGTFFNPYSMCLHILSKRKSLSPTCSFHVERRQMKTLGINCKSSRLSVPGRISQGEVIGGIENIRFVTHPLMFGRLNEELLLKCVLFVKRKNPQKPHLHVYIACKLKKK